MSGAGTFADRVIRENPASRGTETSAEELVGPPWRIVSNAGQQQWYGGYPCTRRRPNGSLRPVNRPPPHPPLQSASEGIGNKKKNGERFWMGKLKGFRLR